LDPVFAQSMLSAEGIEYIVEGDGHRDIAASGNLLGAAGVLVNPTRILVRREDAETANALLADMGVGVAEPDGDELPVPDDAAPALDRRIGEGDFPAELDRVNWGAVLWGPIWALSHRLWSWVLILSLATLLTAVLLTAVLVLSGLHDVLPVRLAALSLSAALYWCVVAFFGLRANRLVWERESRVTLARADQPLPHSSASLTRYVEVQRGWLDSGLSLTGLVWGWGYFNAVRHAEPLAIQTVKIVVTLGVLGVLFVHDKRRQAALGEDGEQASGGDASLRRV
jgi:hypothetical protein